MLPTVLESGLLVMELLLKLGDILFDISRFIGKTLGQCVRRDCNEPMSRSVLAASRSLSITKHFADTLIDIGVLGQTGEFI